MKPFLTNEDRILIAFLATLATIRFGGAGDNLTVALVAVLGALAQNFRKSQVGPNENVNVESGK